MAQRSFMLSSMLWILWRLYSENEGTENVELMNTQMLKNCIHSNFQIWVVGVFFWCTVGNKWLFSYFPHQISGDMNRKTWSAVRKLSVCKTNSWSRFNKGFYQTARIWKSLGILLELWFLNYSDEGSSRGFFRETTCYFNRSSTS